MFRAQKKNLLLAITVLMKEVLIIHLEIAITENKLKNFNKLRQFSSEINLFVFIEF